MSLIEGVGDEVTVLFVLLLLLVLLYIAWISTSVSERHLVRVVVLDRVRFQEFLRRFTRRRPAVESNRTPPNETSSNPTSEETQQESNSISNLTQEVSKDTDRVSTCPSDENNLETNSDTTATNSQHNTEENSIENSTPSENTSGSLVENSPIISSTHQVGTDSIPVITQEVLDSFLSSTQSTLPSRTENINADGSSQPDIPRTCSSVGSKTQVEDTLPTENTQNTTERTEDSSPSPESPSVEETDSPDGDADEVQEGHIRIRIKYLDDRQKLVQARPEETLAQFKRNHFSVELADNFAVRFVYRGQELREDRSTLQAYKIEDNSVIHCLLSRINQSQPPAHQQAATDPDLGMMMFPLFGLILLLIWYCRFMYRSYFSAMSTLSLVGITFMYCIALLATFRRAAHEHED